MIFIAFIRPVHMSWACWRQRRKARLDRVSGGSSSTLCIKFDPFPSFLYLTPAISFFRSVLHFVAARDGGRNMAAAVLLGAVVNGVVLRVLGKQRDTCCVRDGRASRSTFDRAGGVLHLLACRAVRLHRHRALRRACGGKETKRARPGKRGDGERAAEKGLLAWSM